MYNYNTLEGKIRRVEELRKLQNKIACVPGKYINYTEAVSINHYLGDIIYDLEKQIRSERHPRSIKDKVQAVNKAITNSWGTEFGATLVEQLEHCVTEEDIAQLYDKYLSPN